MNGLTGRLAPPTDVMRFTERSVTVRCSNACFRRRVWETHSNQRRSYICSLRASRAPRSAPLSTSADGPAPWERSPTGPPNMPLFSLFLLGSSFYPAASVELQVSRWISGGHRTGPIDRSRCQERKKIKPVSDYFHITAEKEHKKKWIPLNLLNT